MTSRTAVLDADALIAAARVEVGPARHTALTVLTEALRTEARLHPQGAVAVAAGLVASLRLAAGRAALWERRPEIAATPVTRPVFVTGLLRSGTTLMQNLLNQVHGLRAPALWELMNPVGERTDEAGRERLTAQAQAYVDEYYSVAPLLRALHFLDARRPDECHRLTSPAFTSMVLGMRYRVPSYDAWLAGTGMAAGYSEHRRLLQSIAWRLPAERLLLKCPFHLWSLGDLLAEYPDATVVVMHRDPVVTVGSTCLLCESVRGARSHDIDRLDIGRQWSAATAEGISRHERARAAHPAAAFLDVRYADLMTDPAGAVERVCAALGVPFGEPDRAAVTAHLRANPQHGTGTYRYRAADYGLEDALADGPFEQYRTRFGLSPGRPSS
ncbi:sulfotransferase family protein [Paractinoplanes hotanensis]|uniref:Sulfotransferase n=1 Tax=Paractinoplanes hotanensis TaxID=2906497 RepID=A0ABT0YAP7_9ACTN|nr:sulfotransferase [Actinoplanes hotanensis]MCM4083121.1 sulfotransferase [Actinoplanes hotanensis]